MNVGNSNGEEVVTVRGGSTDRHQISYLNLSGSKESARSNQCDSNRVGSFELREPKIESRPDLLNLSSSKHSSKGLFIEENVRGFTDAVGEF